MFRQQFAQDETRRGPGVICNELIRCRSRSRRPGAEHPACRDSPAGTAGTSGLAAGEIGGVLMVAPATLSFHLKELAHAGLPRSRQEGRYVAYAANFDAMNALLAFLTENCCTADCGPSCATAVDGRPDKAAWQARAPASKVGKTKALAPFVFGAVAGWSAGSRDEGAFA